MSDNTGSSTAQQSDEYQSKGKQIEQHSGDVSMDEDEEAEDSGAEAVSLATIMRHKTNRDRNQKVLYSKIDHGNTNEQKRLKKTI